MIFVFVLLNYTLFYSLHEYTTFYPIMTDIAAKNNVNLDISNSDITKVVIMSKEAVAQNDNVDSLGKGVKGMGSADHKAESTVSASVSVMPKCV